MDDYPLHSEDGFVRWLKGISGAEAKYGINPAKHFFTRTFRCFSWQLGTEAYLSGAITYDSPCATTAHIPVSHT
jgi:hypothetical protein